MLLRLFVALLIVVLTSTTEDYVCRTDMECEQVFGQLED